MEYGEENTCTYKDQLCHILNYGKIILCLVCKTTISSTMNIRSRQRRISGHLRSPNHMKSMRTLFKMSIPDPVCDNDGEKYLDIVTNSVFDISVVIGEESSYICQKDKHIVCLMCNSSISKVTSLFTQIKDEIIQHLESVEHANSIKEVCWFYRLNSKKDYLLLHKSVMHCSVCEETVECKETELLQTAVDHLESNTHEVKHHLQPIGVKRKNSDHQNESTKKYFKYDDSEINEQRNEFKVIKSEFIGKTNPPLKLEHVEQLSEYSLDRYKESKVNDSVKPLSGRKMEMLGSSSLCISSLKAMEQSPNINENCPSGSDIIEELLMNTCPFVLQNRQFLIVRDKLLFCTICCKTIHIKMCRNVRGKFRKSKRLERILLYHVASEEHVESLNNLGDRDWKITTVQELFVESDFKYFKIIFRNVKRSNPMKMFLLQQTPLLTATEDQRSHVQEEQASFESEANKPKTRKETLIEKRSRRKKQKQILINTEIKNIESFIGKTQALHRQLQAHNGLSDDLHSAQDDVCFHQREKVLGKCESCLKSVLKSVCPVTLNNQAIYIKIKDNSCVCKGCRETLSTKDIDSLKMSYVKHYLIHLRRGQMRPKKINRKNERSVTKGIELRKRRPEKKREKKKKTIRAALKKE